MDPKSDATQPVASASAQPAQSAEVVQAQAATTEAQKPAETAQKPAARAFVRKVEAKPAPEAAPPAKADAADPKADSKGRIGARALTTMRNKLDAANARADEANALREELGHYAKEQLAAAPEKARKYVLAKHKDDPRAQLAELRALRESGLLDEAKPAAPSIADQTAANTAPPKSPTPDSTDPDVVAAKQYAALEENPATNLIASAFLSANKAAITRGKQKLASKN